MGENLGVQTTHAATRQAVRRVGPFLASLALHAGVVGVGFLAFQSVKHFITTHFDQTTVAKSDLIEPALTADLNPSFRGNSDQPLVKPTQANIPDIDAKGWNDYRGNDRSSLTRLGADAASNTEPDASQVIGLGPGSGSFSHRGTGSGDGGPLAAFGIPQKGGSPNIFINRDTPSARSVAFLCDASGSMLRKFDSLRHELDKAVQGLKPSQSFGITFFQDTRSLSLSPQQLLVANPENKLKAMNFLSDVSPRGTTDPVPSLELAFKQKPQLVFLLTDGDFPDNEAVLARVRQLNADHRVRINTIAFVDQSDTDTAFIALLKQIAQENGGTYRHVNLDELP